jgi:N-acetylmuramoyl-L-alanine amidase
MKINNIVIWSMLFMAVIASGQSSYIAVIAEKGDGVYSLLRKQGVDPYETFDDFIALNHENLRDSIHLYEGRTYFLPSADSISVAEDLKEEKPKLENAISYPIFGNKYAEVTTKSSKLKGAVYYLISGHGGPDPGAMTKFGDVYISEDEYAYDITLRLARELISHDALVYIIIRDEDDGIRDDLILEMDKDEVAFPDKTIPLNQVARLKQRVEIVNELHKKHSGQFQRLIVTHVDSRSKGQNIDVFFYHHADSKNGKKLAENIHTTFAKKYRKYQPNRTYSGTFVDRTSLYLVKKTHPAMTFIEIGNIKNRKDQKRILEPDNRQALAKWISEGVLLDFEEGEIGPIR